MLLFFFLLEDFANVALFVHQSSAACFILANTELYELQHQNVLYVIIKSQNCCLEHYFSICSDPSTKMIQLDSQSWDYLACESGCS